MPGRKGMNRGGMGGLRIGAGRKRVAFPVRRHQVLVLERETIGGEIRQSELVRVLSVGAHALEMQVGDDLLVLRVPDTDEP